jgi:hypothetical protein
VNESEMKNLRMKVINLLTEKLHAALKCEFEVHLKIAGNDFDYRKMVTYLFDGVEMEIYIQGVTTKHAGCKRFVNKAQLPDGRSYSFEADPTLPNPMTMFVVSGGDSDQLVRLLKKAE